MKEFPMIDPLPSLPLTVQDDRLTGQDDRRGSDALAGV
jgi:hypothetical protein